MEIEARIRGIHYTSVLNRELSIFDEQQFPEALRSGSFLLQTSTSQSFACSVWLTPKRSRTHPLARVYDTLKGVERKVAFIPLVKDEADGDCDYLQWDTVALMGLLGIYVIPGYYSDAELSVRNTKKLTNFVWDAWYLKQQMELLKNYHSSAVHWNMEQFNKLAALADKALNAHSMLSTKFGIEMRSLKSLPRKIEELKLGQQNFLTQGRMRSKSAQMRETSTVQPKEFFLGNKAGITITDLVGGVYHLTADDCLIRDDTIFLVESKHSETAGLSSSESIKEGLIKMALFCNIIEVRCLERFYKPVAVLRLACGDAVKSLSSAQAQTVNNLKLESELNGFLLDLTDLHSL
ncbi:MAG: hypothetical protein EKK48_29735 [Candidatus Melainabacteria bacterium]|nr:MAG: hypothetical protein EKK48_29735 [Candidatus Melainabacteria bacterium]